ncbi:MAG: hypothetical protein RLZZ15_3708 [Verrucomicrobiota bacterium]|jgi:hypothetical protein
MRLPLPRLLVILGLIAIAFLLGFAVKAIAQPVLVSAFVAP